MPTVSEIAEHAGVAKSTVSLVLNNKPGVSEEMRHRVLEAMGQLRATEEAQSLISLSANAEAATRTQKITTGVLSVVVLHPPILRSSQVFSELLQGIQAGATSHQIQLRLANNEPSLPEDHITRLYLSDPSLRPSGVLIIGARQSEPLIDEARELGIPCVLVGRQSSEPTLAAVGRDEEEVTFQATNYLLDMGHRAVAFVGGDEAYSYTHSRLGGYRRALEQRDGPTPDRWIVLGDGRTAAERVLASSPEITAVIFINDAYAMEGLPVFQASGRVIPDDLSVISFDDTEDARSFDPPLTAVSYPRFQEGLWSVRVLVDHIRQPLIKSCQVVFRASLIKRDSCTSPRTA
jgi:DNA-binding LacI/PurR family transcriptional regulator